jgi:hypothetical protein
VLPRGQSVARCAQPARAAPVPSAQSPQYPARARPEPHALHQVCAGKWGGRVTQIPSGRTRTSAPTNVRNVGSTLRQSWRSPQNLPNRPAVLARSTVGLLASRRTRARSRPSTPRWGSAPPPSPGGFMETEAVPATTKQQTHWLLGGQATVDDKCAACDKCCVIGRQIQRRLRHFFR